MVPLSASPAYNGGDDRAVMQALSVIPGTLNSAALIDMPMLPRADGSILVRPLAIAVCGTDTQIVGAYGWAPPDAERLVLGHEPLGQVIEASPGSGFATNDLVVGILRRPDPLRCLACGAGERHMCRNEGRWPAQLISRRVPLARWSEALVRRPDDIKTVIVFAA
jgi:threonine dehydrogenase-like Zn-dependent dehydrogenase